MKSFNLDTNCIVDIDEDRRQARYVSELAERHTLNEIDVAIVAISASERQKGGFFFSNYDEFINRLSSLELDHLKQIYPMCYLDICFLDRSLMCDNNMMDLENRIHQVLFPNIPFSFNEFTRKHGLDSKIGTKAESCKKWRNALCDRQMFWAHTYHERDVFVTSDKNFKKKLGASSEFSATKIMTPEEACECI